MNLFLLLQFTLRCYVFVFPDKTLGSENTHQSIKVYNPFKNGVNIYLNLRRFSTFSNKRLYSKLNL